MKKLRIGMIIVGVKRTMKRLICQLNTSKALNIIFIVIGLPTGVIAIIDLTQSNDGEILWGIEMSHPYYGLFQLAIASVMLLAAYKHFKKRKQIGKGFPSIKLDEKWKRQS